LQGRAHFAAVAQVRTAAPLPGQIKPGKTGRGATMGRPSKYRDEFVGQAKKLCAQGATNDDLATYFGVSVSSIKLWRAEHREFSTALKVGKAVADRRVEEALFQRAVGYEHDEVDLRVVGSKLVKTSLRKHYPPDTTAAIFWLKNRKPKDWRDKTTQEHTGPNGGPVQQVQLSMTPAEYEAATQSAFSKLFGKDEPKPS
jgi:hypothetical protein